MKQLVILIFLAFIAAGAQANEICASWEMKIEPDMQIPESDFTLEASVGALERLAQLSREPRTEESWFAEANALRFVRGWLLKKAAIETLDETQSSTDTEEVQEFCKFLVKEAFYYD